MKILQSGTLLLAWLLLLLHSVTPHQHLVREQDQGIRHVTAANVNDFLNLVFLSDLGTNHLEDYAPEWDGPVCQGCPIDIQSHSFVDLLSDDFPAIIELLLSVQKPLGISHRGPPHLA